MKKLVAITFGLLTIFNIFADPFGTAFTYQGRLIDGGNPANGSYDLRFAIYDSTNSPGTLIAGPLTNAPSAASNGQFIVTLDFGTNVFTGADRWLEIAARTNGAAGSYTTLSPRQHITPVPYAIEAATAGGVSGVIPDTQLSANIPRLNGTNNFTGKVLLNLVSGTLGINKTNPTVALDVNGTVSSTNIITPQLTSHFPGENLQISAASGTGNGGQLNITAGNAGVANGGAGGNLTLQAGSAMPQGGAGWYNQGAAGIVSILGGGGYNGVGGDVILQSGPNNLWTQTPDSFSKVSIRGGNLSPGDGAIINVEGGHNKTSPSYNSSGGNVWIMAGNAAGPYPGGNVIMLPGSGSTPGYVGIGVTNPAAMLHVNGTVTAINFSGNGSGLTNLNAANLAGTVPDAQLSANVPRLNGTSVFTGPVTATGFFGNGTGLSGVAPATGSSNYVAKAGDTMTGTLALPANGFVVGGNQLVLANGKVGIGTNNPQATLDVNGTVKAASFIGDGSGLTNLNAPLASFINANSISIGPTNLIAPLTVAPNVPISAVGSVGTADSPVCVRVSGLYAYAVNSRSNTLQVFDVRTPYAPVVVGSVLTALRPSSVAVAGRYAYVVSQTPGTLQVFDVSNPSEPLLLGSVGTGIIANSIALAGRYAYVVGQSPDTMQVFDVSNPFLPVKVGSIGTDAVPVSVAVAGCYAYVVNFNGGTLRIFDVSTPSAPISVGSLATASNPLSVAVAEHYAYVADWGNSTLQVIDVSNPSTPASVGSVGTTASPNYVTVAGRYAYVLSGSGNKLQLFDVGNPLTPASLGSVYTGSFPTCVAVAGRYAYVVNEGDDSFAVFDLGGAYIQQFEAGAIATGTLQTRDTVTVGNNLDVRGGLTVSGSARISGGLNANNIVGGFTTNILIGGHTLYITNGIIMNVQ